MKKSVLIAVLLIGGSCVAWGQFLQGNAGFSNPRASLRPEDRERAKRDLGPREVPPSGRSMFVEANVLLNVKADSYVAVFALSHEAPSVAECQQLMDASVRDFTAALRQLGIGDDDLFVAFVAQNKVYGYDVQNEIARQKLAGFDLKKNVSIHFRDKNLVDKLVAAAARFKIFDLVKVESVIQDQAAAHNRLSDEAAKVLRQKAARHEKLLAIKLQGPAQVYAERFNTYQPSEMFDSYQAEVSEQVAAGAAAWREGLKIVNLRKSPTFYFKPLTSDGFDVVINPVVIEPIVQHTLYMKVKYEISVAPDKT